MFFMDMSFQEMAAVKEMFGDHSGGKWGQNTALWAIVALIVIFAIVLWIWKSGDDKADLAAAVQKLYGRVDAIEPAVTAQGNSISDLKSVSAATAQSVGDFKKFAIAQLNDLDNAVYVPRYAVSPGCGCGDSRFVKKSEFTPGTITVEQIERCG